METQLKAAKRGGGRAARQAMRAAPLAEDKRPVRPGLAGGAYKPLTEAGVERIHQAALDALEVVGFTNAPASTVEILTRAGAIHGADGRIRFPRALVEDMVAIAARDITLFARDPRYDMQLSGPRVHYGTAGAAVNVVDVEKREYRPSETKDLLHAAQLAEALDNIHFFQRPMVCRDAIDNLELDTNTVYACAAGTKKHIGVSFIEASTLDACFEILYAIAGSEKAWRERPFASNSNCFVVPPFTFAEESCAVLEGCVARGMPILLLSAGQAGATAPAPLAAAVVQAMAECLAGLVYVNAIQPGHPAIFGTWPFVSDLRSGAMSGGSGEQALLTAACAQMHQFYNLPGGAAAGIADSKLPDMQAGWEQAISNVMAGLAGLNLVYEAVGMHASLLGFSLESMVLGDDLLGQALRCVRGVEVTEDSVNIETIKAVCMGGPGHYLGQPQTLSVMETEYVYPRVADRMSPKEWNEVGRPDLVDRAIARKTKILAEAQIQIPADVDAEIRRKFKIYC